MLKIFSFMAMLHNVFGCLASAGLYRILARMYSISRVFSIDYCNLMNKTPKTFNILSIQNNFITIIVNNSLRKTNL